jgi:hypothetical protein
MDEKDFKKHLRDLAHGHHHPEEHDWTQSGPPAKAPAVKTARKSAARKPKRRTK